MAYMTKEGISEGLERKMKRSIHTVSIFIT